MTFLKKIPVKIFTGKINIFQDWFGKDSKQMQQVTSTKNQTSKLQQNLRASDEKRGNVCYMPIPRLETGAFTFDEWMIILYHANERQHPPG